MMTNVNESNIFFLMAAVPAVPAVVDGDLVRSCINDFLLASGAVLTHGSSDQAGEERKTDEHIANVMYTVSISFSEFQK